jgi:hypothetical protein
MNNNTPTWIAPVARAGLIAKGVVYCLVGLLAFMAAFHLGGQSTNKADTTGALQFVEDMPAGKWLLLAIGIGLLCYALWRVVEAFTQNKKSDSGVKKAGNKLRLVLSGLGYLALGIAAIKMVLDFSQNSGGNSNQKVASGILNQPMGQWLLGLLALILAGVGIYQIYYALSEKYKKHVSSLPAEASGIMLKAGKAGFIARGIVWLIIAWMLLKASMQNNASKAGDTSQAFGFLQDSSYGSILLGIISAGFICYGVFCFIRAGYEHFD